MPYLAEVSRESFPLNVFGQIKMRKMLKCVQIVPAPIYSFT